MSTNRLFERAEALTTAGAFFMLLSLALTWGAILLVIAYDEARANVLVMPPLLGIALGAVVFAAGRYYMQLALDSISIQRI